MRNFLRLLPLAAVLSAATVALAGTIDLPWAYLSVQGGNDRHGWMGAYGPIFDRADDRSAINAEGKATASVDTSGALHAMASSFIGEACPYWEGCANDMSAWATVGIRNPFIVQRPPGVTDSTGLIEIKWAIEGEIGEMLAPLGCGYGCHHDVQYELAFQGVDSTWYADSGQYGVVNDPQWLGHYKRTGFFPGATYANRPPDTAGKLIAVPYDTELWLAAILQVSSSVSTTDSGGGGISAWVNFGDTAKYNVISPDNATIVWGLTPQSDTAVPEPSTVLLLGGALAAFAAIAKRRRAGIRAAQN